MSAVPIDVSPVASGRDLRAFIELPYRLHRDAGAWIAPLRLDQRLLLSRRLNAFFKHGSAEYFLARRDGRVVGRVTAHIDRHFSAYQGNRWGWFGFLEVEDDAEAATALLDAAAGWLAARGRDRMIGPASFTMNDESGLVVEGFDREPCIRQPWHPPYYQPLVEGTGMRKVVDLLTFEIKLTGKSDVMPVLWELADKVESEHGIVVRNMSRRRLRRDLDTFAEIYNVAWRRNFGFWPYEKRDLDAYALEMQLVFDHRWFLVAERKDTGEPVGLNISIPDVNQAIKHMNGRILPFGWWHYLRRQTTMDRVRVGFLGVKPEYQHTGVAAKLYQVQYELAPTRRQQTGEAGWILETNTNMIRGIEMMGGALIKRYRIYERLLEADAEPATARPPRAAAS